MHIGTQPVGSAAIVAALAANPAVWPDGSIAAPGAAFAAEPGTGFFRAGTGQLGYAVGGTYRMNFSGNALIMRPSHQLAWASGDPTSADLALARDAANALAQRNGVNAQAFRLYNTFTDASNYERMALGWAGNIFSIAMEGAGTGSTSRNIRLDAQSTQIDVTPSGVVVRRNGSSISSLLELTSSGLTSTALLFARLTPTINQASGSYTVLDVNPTETAIGAGPHYLLRARVGAGGNVFAVGNTGLVEVNGTLSLGGSLIAMAERADPAAPGANVGFVYMRDNGSGKTQLVARFPTGAVQVIATEP